MNIEWESVWMSLTLDDLISGLVKLCMGLYPDEINSILEDIWMR